MPAQAQIIDFAQARASLKVADVMRETQDAYSRPAYGEAEWAKCAALLLALGHSVDLTAALMGSRLMRWARENGAKYDAPTAADMDAFLMTPAGVNALRCELAA